jgi:hypothetical protein
MAFRTPDRNAGGRRGAFIAGYACAGSRSGGHGLCNFEVDWCEALKATYEKTTARKPFVIRRTDARVSRRSARTQQPARRRLPRSRVRHQAKQLRRRVCSRRTSRRTSPRLHDWAQRIAEENNYFQTPIYTGVLGMGLQHRAFSPRRRCPSPSAGRISSTRPTAMKSRMGEPRHVRHRVQHRLDDPAADGRGRGFKFLAAMNKTSISTRGS